MIPYSKQYSLQTTEERNLLQESFCLIIVSLLPKHMREIEIISGPLLLFGLFLIQSITELQLSTIRFVSKLSQNHFSPFQASPVQNTEHLVH